MSKNQDSSISKQKEQVFNNSGKVKLVSACGIGSGVIGASELKASDAIEAYENSTKSMSFFIPASGSGSRMFQFLFEYINTGELTEDVSYFFNHLSEFAFYSLLPDSIIDKVNKDNIAVANYLLSNRGLNFRNKSKGLIEFHKWNNCLLTPFQEHLLQADRLFEGKGDIHFTIQEGQKKEIQSSIEAVKNELNYPIKTSYSYQSAGSNAYCFNDERELVMSGEVPLRRPSGHGALLSNINKLDAEVVLIKNIDNIQSMENCDPSLNAWKISVGYLHMFEEALKKIKSNFSVESFIELNSHYQFLSDEEANSMTSSLFDLIFSRPTRVCGMVKNEGKVGGGPFWIDDEGQTSKQIIEMMQISDDIQQQDIMKGSSHFNPVFIALSKVRPDNSLIDLKNYVDDSKFLRVKKSHQGTTIHYRELPGLWNGAMHNWNSIFIELPKEVFTPVKSVLDLIQ